MPGPVKIYCCSSEKLVDALVRDGISPLALQDYEKNWTPLLKQGSTEDSHWEWRAKLAHASPPDSYEHYTLELKGRAQGLMQVVVKGYRGRLSGGPIVYVDYLAVAPWNRSGSPPQYKLVGSVLLAEAVAVSLRQGYKGRLGLHSLPGAAPFYTKCNMTGGGCDKDYYGLEYFEFTEENASRFLVSAGGGK